MAATQKIESQTQLDAAIAGGKLGGGVTFEFAPGDFIVRDTLMLGARGPVSLIGAANRQTILRFGRSGDHDKSMFNLSGSLVRVSGFTLAPNGCDAFRVSGAGHLIAANAIPVSQDVWTFVRINTGGDGVLIADNIVPAVGEYFCITGGRKYEAKDNAGIAFIATDPVTRLQLLGNVCLKARFGGHIFRFHDAMDWLVRGNVFARPNDDGMRTIAKVHDGATGIIESNFFSGKDGLDAFAIAKALHSGVLPAMRKLLTAGKYVAHPTVLTFGPLGGADGGLGPRHAGDKMKLERERLLKLLLKGVVVRKNWCDDVLVHLSPGARDLNIDGNTFAHLRDIAFDYKATENSYDYRPMRGDITGAITNNICARVSSCQKPLFSGNMPKAIKRAGNQLDGKVAA